MQTKRRRPPFMPTLLNRFMIASPANFEKCGRDLVQFLSQIPLVHTGPWKDADRTPRDAAEPKAPPVLEQGPALPQMERMGGWPVPDGLDTQRPPCCRAASNWIESAGAGLARQLVAPPAQDRYERHSALWP